MRFLGGRLSGLGCSGGGLGAVLDEVGAVLNAVGVVSEAALDEVGVVTVAASIREVEVELEAGMVIADVGRANLGVGFENKALP